MLIAAADSTWPEEGPHVLIVAGIQAQQHVCQVVVQLSEAPVFVAGVLDELLCSR